MEEAQVMQMDALGDAKRGEPPAYKGQQLRILLRLEGNFVGACSVGADSRIGGSWCLCHERLCQKSNIT